MKEKFTVSGMKCAACSSATERAVSKLEGVTSVSVNLDGAFMICDYDENKIKKEAIITAVKKAGFKGAGGYDGAADAQGRGCNRPTRAGSPCGNRNQIAFLIQTDRRI